MEILKGRGGVPGAKIQKKTMEMNWNSVLCPMLTAMEILRGVSGAKIQMGLHWISVLFPLLTVMEMLRGRGGVSGAKFQKNLWK